MLYFIPKLKPSLQSHSLPTLNLTHFLLSISVSTLPNMLVMGILMLYGEYSNKLMVQVVVLQCII